MKKSTELTLFNDKNYDALLNAAKAKIQSVRIKIARSACKEQIDLYWWIGEQIVNAQEKYGWGKSIINQLAIDLRTNFTGTTTGFSPQNLWYMRQFYLEYKNCPNLQQLVGDLAWGQNLVILSKIKDNEAREYYLRTTAEMGWTRRILVLQIESQAYERHILERKDHNFQKALPEHLAEQADKALKNIYLLDTLGLTQPVLEAQIEERMVDKIKDVMLELGYGFAFLGNQYRIMAPSGTESFIDLLFYNRRLQCLVAIELKTGKFKPEYTGKMNYYLNLLDDLVKEPWENPSVGIILCASKNHIDVEYALRGLNKPMGIAEFKLTRTLPEELSNKLPHAEEIESLVLKQMTEA